MNYLIFILIFAITSPVYGQDNLSSIVADALADEFNAEHELKDTSGDYYVWEIEFDHRYKFSYVRSGVYSFVRKYSDIYQTDPWQRGLDYQDSYMAVFAIEKRGRDRLFSVAFIDETDRINLIIEKQ